MAGSEPVTREDYDLDIAAENNNEWTVSGDIPGETSEQPWDCVFSQDGSVVGLQVIHNAEIEWPARERLILSMGELLHKMREVVP